MGIVITVDLGTSSPSDIARAAKFMLECAGYQDPSVGSNQTARDSWVGSQSFPEATGGLVGPRGSLGEEISDDNGPLPATTFGGAAPKFSASLLGTHGSPELDADAAKLTAMGADAGPTFEVDPATFETRISPTLPPPPPGIEVDAQGVPWDQRIHAGSRAKIADGTWRQRRNLDPVVFKQVMDELRATMGVERRAPTPPAPPAPVEVFAPHPPVPPIPVAPPVPPVVISHPEVPQPGVTAEMSRALDNARAAGAPPAPFAHSAVPPAPPTTSTPTTPPPTAPAGAAGTASPSSLPTFPQLMQRITAAFTAKTLDQPTIIAAVQKVGLSSLPMLASRPDLVADVATELGIAL